MTAGDKTAGDKRIDKYLEGLDRITNKYASESSKIQGSILFSLSAVITELARINDTLDAVVADFEEVT